MLGRGGSVALCPGVGEAARGRDAAHGALDRGGARARLSSPVTAHAACATTAHWYVGSLFIMSAILACWHSLGT